MSVLLARFEQRLAEGHLRPDAGQRAVIAALERIEAGLALPPRRGLFRKPPSPVRGAYIWGGVGRGKSMLMDLLAETAPVPVWRRHFHAFMQWVHRELDMARKLRVDDAIQPVAQKIIRDTRLLCLDEMQITDIADAMLVGRLFLAILDGGVTVVTTSNRPPDDLYKDGLSRELFLPFIALMKDRLEVLELSGPTDYRQGRATQDTRYFTPIDAQARLAIGAVWDRLTRGAVTPMDIPVLGRKLHLAATGNGAARASFFDLCGQPLGPADYLALTGAVHTLILEDIPQLSAENFNQARRFVTLVDALYEARTRLYCTAAARPEMLYIEGEGSFEFERTASRLQEMQAATWGQT